MRAISSRSGLPQSRLITVSDFAALYRAAEFSLLNGYPLASHVIINWNALGADADDKAADGFLGFTKCIRDFLKRRLVPPLWIYVHERSPKTGLHTHIAIFLPVDAPELRTECMEWLRYWPIRQLGRRVPHGIRMRVPQAHEIRLHWLIFNYLVKGYDPLAVVQSAQRAPGGTPIMLGDLIAFPRRDPGAVTLRKRIGFSRALGPGEQAGGLPASWSAWMRPAAKFRLTAKSQPVQLPTRLAPTFRSTFDDACYDVRQLYGAEFHEWVAGGYAGALK